MTTRLRLRARRTPPPRARSARTPGVTPRRERSPRCAPRSGSPRATPRATAASSRARSRTVPQPLTADTASDISSKSSLSMPGLPITFMRSRAGMRLVLAVFDQVQEAVVDVVHAHDGRGRLARASSAAAPRLRAPTRPRRCARTSALREAMRRGERNAPDLLLSSPERRLGGARCRGSASGRWRSRAARSSSLDGHDDLRDSRSGDSGDASRLGLSRRLGRLQGVFALLPVAGAQLVGLQRVEHAQHFLRVAADVRSVTYTKRITPSGSTM